MRDLETWMVSALSIDQWELLDCSGHRPSGLCVKWPWLAGRLEEPEWAPTRRLGKALIENQSPLVLSMQRAHNLVQARMSSDTETWTSFRENCLNSKTQSNAASYPRLLRFECGGEFGIWAGIGVWTNKNWLYLGVHMRIRSRSFVETPDWFKKLESLSNSSSARQIPSLTRSKLTPWCL